MLPTAAAPANCSNKCYGIATWNPNAYYGTISYVNARTLHVDDHCNAFAADISWVIDQTGWAWIESGLINGKHSWEGGCFGLWYFWADNSSCYGFYAEAWGGAAYNTDFAARIEHVYGGGWQILRNGSPMGWAPCHPAPIWVAQAGLEADGNTGFNADVRAHTFQKRNAAGGWSYGWPGSSLYATPPAGAAWCGTLCLNGWLLG